MGADLDTAAVKKDHADFAAAGERLRVAGKKLGDRKIIATSPSADVMYVSDPTKSPDPSYFTDELDLPIIQPTNVKEVDYFESLSWENADKYGGDIALYDARIGAASLTLCEIQPVWR